MNAVVMDNVMIGKECIVGALSFIKEGMDIPDRKVVVGNPAKVVKDVTDEMAQWKTEGTGWYQRLPKQLHDTLKECDPLRKVPQDRKDQTGNYHTWGKQKK
jgi:carbonic anhydrase/acetyltransferase-like protein (isoleucine patch superfamily)